MTFIRCAGFLLLLATALPGPAASQSGDARDTPSTVELLVDVYGKKGRPPLDLAAEDLEVREAGEVMTVLDVRPLAGADGLAARRHDELTRPLEVPWRILIYFDSALLAHPSRIEAAVLLGDAARHLTALGSVQVVSADSTPRIWLDWTRDPKLVLSTLRSYAVSATSGGDLARLRGRFRQESAAGSGPADEAELDRRRERWKSYVEAETALVESRLDVLRGWLARELADAPSALLWICGGFDLDPRAFYLRELPEGGLREVLERELRAVDPSFAFDELVRSVQRPPWLWTVVPVAPPDAVVREDSETEALVDGPRAPLATIAAETGGLVMEGRRDLMEVLTSLGRRFAVTYRRDRPAAGERRPLEVRSRRAHLETRAVRRLSVPDPAEVDSARALAMLGPRPDNGEMEAECGFERTRPERDSAGDSVPRLECKITIAESWVTAGGAAAGEPPIRMVLTTAVAGAAGVPSILEQHDYDLPRPKKTREAVQLTVPIRPPDGTAAVGLVLREEETGSWIGLRLAPPAGLARAEAVAASEAAEASAASPHRVDLDLLPPLADTRPVYLSPLGRATVAGRVLIEAQAVDHDVARVAFWLDDELVATVARPPFETWLKLPKLPEPRTIRAVALDRDGRELGGDAVRVNQGLDTFDVTLRRLQDLSEGGPIDVEVDVRAPFRRSVQRVELYWQGELRATLPHPPYRYRLPDAIAAGDYVRAVATLDNGTSAEDVLLLGQEGFKSEVDVERVELYTVVRDRGGKLVGDLEERDFEIREDGLVQTMKSFQHPVDTPLTLGLVVDISDSLGDEMPLVQRAARDFVRQVLEPGDRGFLMAFDHRVYLIQQQTGDLDLLERSIGILRPGHGTSLYDATIMALLNLRSVHGRRSLVILTDGADLHSRHSFEQTLELARRSGVPLYVIGLGASGSSSHRKKMAKLARVTGADLHVIRLAEQLGDAYGAIAEELDGQYLLTYESSQARDRAGWREVTLEVSRAQLDARTISGYFVR